MEADGGARRALKKGLDVDLAVRKREEQQVQLRRQQRDEQLRKKRQGFGIGERGPVPIYRDPTTSRHLKELPQLVAKLLSSSPQDQSDAVVAFRRLLSIERNPPIQEVIDTGVVPRLIEMLTFRNQPGLVFEATWTLTNITSSSSAHTACVVESGAVPILIELLHEDNEEIKEQAVWAISNIAGDSVLYRDLVIASGVLPSLLSMTTGSSKSSLLRNVTWCISNLCRGKPQPEFELIAPILSVLPTLLYNSDEEVLADACWALSYISDDTAPDNSRIQEVIKTGVVRRLVELLLHSSNTVKIPALRTIGNIVTGNDLQTQVVINLGGLVGLLSLLSNDKKGIRKESCWTISNITAGNASQIQAVLEANIFPMLLSLMKNDEFDVRKECAWAVSNVTSGGTREQIIYLVQQGAIPALCDLIDCGDPKITLVVMEGLDNILRIGQQLSAETGTGVNVYANYVEECGGSDKIEIAQHHENLDVYRKAAMLLRTYFELEDVDTGVAPSVSADASSYAFGATAPSGGAYNF